MPGRATASTQGPAGADDVVNEVRLSGRISGAPQLRELPSGDRVVQLRVVVRRAGPARPRGSGGSATVDTIDVACWAKTLQRKAMRLQDGDLVELSGALRRRFWRAPTGPASRYEVEVVSLSRHPGNGT